MRTNRHSAAIFLFSTPETSKCRRQAVRLRAEQHWKVQDCRIRAARLHNMLIIIQHARQLTG